MINTNFNCAICGRKCKNGNSLAQHLKLHNITSKEYWDKYIEPNVSHVCKFCGKDISNRFQNITLGYFKTCSIECSRRNVFKNIDYEQRNLKSKKTKYDKYGDETYNNHKKALKTWRNKTSQELKQINDKRKQTNIERRGVGYPMQSEEVKKKHKENYKNKTGYDHPSVNPKVREKTKKTNLERYDAENVFASEYGKQKIKETNLEKYGAENPQQNRKIREKTKETTRDRYGVDCCWSNPEIYKKCSRKYFYDNTYFDSSYELALYIYLSDIGKNFEYHPDVYFEFDFNDKVHRCFPDFKIENDLFEIKGSQFVDENTGEWKDPYYTHNDAFYELKRQCLLKNNVKILYYDDLLDVFNFINNKYGKSYLSKFRKTDKNND